VRHALEAVKAVDFPVQTFGGAKRFLPQALAAWERGTEADGAKREAEARVDEQFRRERDDDGWPTHAPRRRRDGTHAS
jgi:hypothetical protein